MKHKGNTNWATYKEKGERNAQMIVTPSEPTPTTALQPAPCGLLALHPQLCCLAACTLRHCTLQLLRLRPCSLQQPCSLGAFEPGSPHWPEASEYKAAFEPSRRGLQIRFQLYIIVSACLPSLNIIVLSFTVPVS